MGARELDEDWTKILETGRLVQHKSSEGQYQTRSTPTGNNITSQQYNYVGTFYSLPVIRHSPGNHDKMRYYPRQRLCTYCCYKQSVLQKIHKV